MLEGWQKEIGVNDQEFVQSKDCFFKCWEFLRVIFLRLLESAKKTSKRYLDKYNAIETQAERSGLLESYNDRVKHYLKTIEELEQSNKQLDQEVQQRKENEERMRRYVTHLSHEFKTPLGIISGFLEIIEEGCFEKEPSYYTTTMARELGKLNALVLETLEASELEGGNLVVKVDYFDPSPLIQEIVDRFHKQCKDKALTLEIDLEDAVVLGDVLRIEQVLVNLLSNGIKYSPYGERLRISSCKTLNDLEIRIKNEGVTISEEDLSEIWNYFYRVNKRSNIESEGNGVGLAIVKKILELHQSEFCISNEGNAVVFSFTLKLKS